MRGQFARFVRSDGHHPGQQPASDVDLQSDIGGVSVTALLDDDDQHHIVCESVVESRVAATTTTTCLHQHDDIPGNHQTATIPSSALNLLAYRVSHTVGK